MHLLLLLLPVLLHAQDLRSVAEPVFPPPCTQLQAQNSTSAPDETHLDTAAVQSALNACAAGQAVELQASGANDAFLTGPLTLPKGVTLLIDPGVTLLASRNPRDYDSSAAQTCGTLTTSGGGCLPFITASHADGAGIMGYGAIDGRGNALMLPGGTPSTLTWWALARSAAGSLTQNNPRLIQISSSDHFTLYKITLRNSPNFHVALGTCTNFTAWGVKIVTPYDARNTDGIDPGYSSNVTITHSYISEGDDNVAVGGNNVPGAKNLSVINNWFGDGHGASIGSYTQYGVSNLLVDHITIAGQTANTNAIGMRIKSDVSRGGLVQNITYSNICLRQVRAAIVIDPFYTAGATGSLIPSYQNITFRNIHATTEGTVKIQGHDAAVPSTVTLDNVQIDNIKASDLTESYVNYTLGPDPVNFASFLKGTGVAIANNVATSNPPYACPAEVFSPLAGELIVGPGPSTVLVQLIPTKANLPAPTGTVTLSNGISAPLNGSQILTLSIPPQSATLTATYSGDTNYSPLTFGHLAQSAPRIASEGIVNAANYANGGAAPGSIVSIFGAGFGATPNVTLTQGGTQYPATVYYASDSQINALIPASLQTGAAEVTVDESNPSTLTIPQSNFGLFGVIQNQDYSVNAQQTPAKPGEIVIVWGTGLGQNPNVAVTVAGNPAELIYAGPQSQFQGDDNIYFRIPAGTPSGCNVTAQIQVGTGTIRTTFCVSQ